MRTLQVNGTAPLARDAFADVLGERRGLGAGGRAAQRNALTEPPGTLRAGLATRIADDDEAAVAEGLALAAAGTRAGQPAAGAPSWLLHALAGYGIRCAGAQTNTAMLSACGQLGISGLTLDPARLHTDIRAHLDSALAAGASGAMTADALRRIGASARYRALADALAGALCEDERPWRKALGERACRHLRGTYAARRGPVSLARHALSDTAERAALAVQMERWLNEGANPDALALRLERALQFAHRAA